MERTQFSQQQQKMGRPQHRVASARRPHTFSAGSRVSRPRCRLSPDGPSAQFRATVWYFASSVGSVLQTTDLSRAQPSQTATSSGIGWPPGMMGMMTDQEKVKAIFQVGNLGHKGRTCVSSTPAGLSPDSALTWPGTVPPHAAWLNP